MAFDAEAGQEIAQQHAEPAHEKNGTATNLIGKPAQHGRHIEHEQHIDGNQQAGDQTAEMQRCADEKDLRGRIDQKRPQQRDDHGDTDRVDQDQQVETNHALVATGSCSRERRLSRIRASRRRMVSGLKLRVEKMKRTRRAPL